MTTEHPITPPTELIKQWLTEFYGPQCSQTHLAAQA